MNRSKIGDVSFRIRGPSDVICLLKFWNFWFMGLFNLMGIIVMSQAIKLFGVEYLKIENDQWLAAVRLSLPRSLFLPISRLLIGGDGPLPTIATNQTYN